MLSSVCAANISGMSHTSSVGVLKDTVKESMEESSIIEEEDEENEEGDQDDENEEEEEEDDEDKGQPGGQKELKMSSLILLNMGKHL